MQSKTIEDLQSFLETMYAGMGLYVFTKSVAIKINLYDNSLVLQLQIQKRGI
jgi:hypothetical protein